MASSDVDQKYLGRLADLTANTNPLVSKSLYQILGLSVLLARKLFRARKLRKLDTTRDTRSLQLYHHIIWLSREGLSLLEVCVLPYTIEGQQGPECQVLTAKLRASFCHIFCLFHNNPPITQAINLVPTSTTPTPLSPRADNGQRRERRDSTASQGKETPKRHSRGKQPSLRDPIASVTSEASFLTNPYAGIPPGTTPPPGLGAPPGLSPIAVPHPSAFLLPAINFVPLTLAHFNAASEIAADALPGAHPLRLSAAVEHAAFLWDCVHNHEASRQLARRAIRELREHEDEGVTDEMFEDAAELVGILGRMMRRRSWEGTPRNGIEVTSPLTPTAAPPTTSLPSIPFPPVTTLASAIPTVPVTAPVPPSPEPTATLSSTPRRIKVYRDEPPPIREGGPVQPITPAANSASRRGGRGSQTTGHAHKRSTSQGTRETVGPLRTPKEQTPPRPPPKDKGKQRAAEPPPRRTPQAAEPAPPRPPPKDYRTPTGGRSRAGTASSGAGSKPTTPKRGTPSDKLEREREKERIKAHEAYEMRQRKLSDASSRQSRTPKSSRPGTGGVEHILTPGQAPTTRTPTTYTPTSRTPMTPKTTAPTTPSPGRPLDHPLSQAQAYTYQSYPQYPTRTPLRPPPSSQRSSSQPRPRSKVPSLAPAEFGPTPTVSAESADLDNYPFTADVGLDMGEAVDGVHDVNGVHIVDGQFVGGFDDWDDQRDYESDDDGRLGRGS